MSTMASQAEHTPSYLIIGLGQTGMSCVRFLVSQGYTVAIMDTREKPPELTNIQTNYPEVLVHVGGLNSDWLQRADVVVLSPGVDQRLPEIVTAKQAGIELVGDIELFARNANAPIVAITGSNGKSTVTTLLAEMVVNSGKTMRVGGNLGTPALELICEPAPDFYIVELSSFQLETVSSLNAFAATVLNVSPDHLDRYDSIDDYQLAKSRIFNGDGVMVINRDDAVVRKFSEIGRNQIGFCLEPSEHCDFGVFEKDGTQWIAEGHQALIAVDEMKIVGKHNVANALAALALGSAMALPMTAMLETLREYSGLPHRCRLVTKFNDVRWINDSKATNVGASLAAIEGLADSGKIILIAGGEGKGQDFSALTHALQEHVRAIVLIGRDAKKIAEIVPKDVAIHYADSMSDAVKVSAEIAQAGECVLLSPACASFDMFTGYADRGNVFEKAVKEIVHE